MSVDPRRDHRRRLRHATLLVSAVAVMLLADVGCVAPASATVPTNTELVMNGSFERGVTGWRTNGGGSSLSISTAAKSGSQAAVLTGPAGSVPVLNDLESTVVGARAGEMYRGSVWVRTNTPGLAGQFRVREVAPDRTVQTHASTYTLEDTAWQLVDLSFTSTANESYFDLNVVAWDIQAGQQLIIDTVSLQRLATQGPVTPPTTPAPAPGAWVLSNGGTLSSRGVPTKGALYGAAYGSNSDPAAFESSMGQRLGLRRTFWGSNQVNSAVSMARTDLAAGRLPWMSFKLPYSWADMATGKGDAWTRDLSLKLAALPGPVWVAFHHEPEGDGNIAQWKSMQERLAPIVRSTAPNVGYTVILTGWNQLYGPSQYSLAAIWPKTKVDVAGFDVYSEYGFVKNGELRLRNLDIKKDYYDPISTWAKSTGVAWGLAESAITDRAAVDHPTWLMTAYRDMVATGGVAYTYFNTSLNAGGGTWAISGGPKASQYSAVLKASPTFPKLK